MEALCILPAFQQIYHRYCHIEARFQQLLHQVSSKENNPVLTNRSINAILSKYNCCEPQQQEQQSQQQGVEDVHTSDSLDMHLKEDHSFTDYTEGCLPTVIVGPDSPHLSAAEEENTTKMNQPVSHYFLDTPHHRGKRDRVPRKSFP
jgi:hypothetical protein